MTTTTITETTDRLIDPNCHACGGTGTDAVFGTDCSECQHTVTLAALRFAGDGRTERVHTPGERLDGRTFGGSTGAATPKQVAFIVSLMIERGLEMDRQAIEAMSKGEASAEIDRLMAMPKVSADGAPVNSCSDKQLAFVRSLLADRDRTDERTAAQCETIETVIASGKMDKRTASDAIDMLKRMPRQRSTAEAPATETPTVPAGYYALPSTGDNDLVFYRVTHNAKWGVSVQQIVGGHADRFVARRNVPGIVERIAADVTGAGKRYADEIGCCYRCNRTLTDDESRARGIGPVCATLD